MKILTQILKERAGGIMDKETFVNDLLKLDCVPFGSRQWGGHTIVSDFDYACSLTAYNKIKREWNRKHFRELKHNSKYKKSEMFNVINSRVFIDAVSYNLVVYSTQEMVNQYKKMNNIASKLGKDVFSSKDNRVKFCEAFDHLLIKPLWDEINESKKPVAPFWDDEEDEDDLGIL